MTSHIIFLSKKGLSNLTFFLGKTNLTHYFLKKLLYTLVLLLYHYRDELGNIYLRSENSLSRNNKNLSCNADVKQFCIKSTKKALEPAVAENLLAIHAWTGCDTTSAIFNIGKTSILKKIITSKELQSACQVMADISATQLSTHNAGRDIFKILYGCSLNISLNELRYKKYMQSLASSNVVVKPQTLPPTEDSAYYHNLRAHLQTINWLTLSNRSLDPILWGWEVDRVTLKYTPITSRQPVAPENLLKFIRCKCKSSSKNPCKSNNCTCRKNGLKCVSSCQNCCGPNGWGCFNMDDIDEHQNNFNIYEP